MFCSDNISIVASETKSGVDILRKLLRTNIVTRRLKLKTEFLRGYKKSSIEVVLQQMHSSGISTVLDIGANVGQFGIDLRISGYKGQIISFEPVSEYFFRLKSTAQKFSHWDAYQIGIGSHDGVMNIAVAANSGLSSSFLKMNEVHLREFPMSFTKRTESVKVGTLDSQIELLGVDPAIIFLKVDTQGFEKAVILGAKKSLPLIPLCLWESSLKPLYDGESSLLQLLNELSTSGHEVVDIFRGAVSPSGKLLQVDVLTRSART